MLASMPFSFAQSDGIKRTVAGRGDVSVVGREALIVRVEIEKDALIVRHSHHGDEIGYLLDGEIVMSIDGAQSRRLKSGEAFIVPSGKMHEARNVGNGTAVVIVTYVVEKGKALAVPAR
jgi:quercetin dioxygenase-like cupin family protein